MRGLQLEWCHDLQDVNINRRAFDADRAGAAVKKRGNPLFEGTFHLQTGEQRRSTRTVAELLPESS